MTLYGNDMTLYAKYFVTVQIVSTILPMCCEVSMSR